MNVIDAARVVYADCLNLNQEMEPEKRFAIIRDKYTDFVLKYPLVVKYMVVFCLYNENLFIDLTNFIQKTRPDHLHSLEYQANYIKNLLLHLRDKNVVTLDRAKIKQISNIEYESAAKEYTTILRLEKEAKKEMKSKDITDEEELRKEFKNFILNVSGEN